MTGPTSRVTTDPPPQHRPAAIRARHSVYARLDPRDESGAVLILVALLMTAFLGLGAMAVDLGALYDHDRDLQTAADAGALAGAQELVYTAGGTAPAATRAVEYVDGNVAASSVEAANLDPWAPVVDSRSCTVDLQESGVPFFLAPAVGVDDGTVRAHARAEVKYLTGVTTAFPVAVNYMNPHRFRFVFKDGGGTVVHTLDVADPDGDGTFSSLAGGGSFTPPAAGLYTIDLQAIDSDGEVGVELPEIGLWRASDPADPDEKLFRVGMQRAVGGSTVTVRIEVAPAVTDASIGARLGNNGFDLLPLGGGVYEGTVEAPTKTGNDGWQTHDLTIQKLTGNQSVARYIALHPDVPLRYLMFEPGFYGGYSGFAGVSDSLGATIIVRVMRFGDTYVMKLGNEAGSGLYSGNWRIADVYSGQNTYSEIATVPIPDTWELVHPLTIGGPLEPEAGAAVGQIRNGLDDRLSGHSPAFTAEELASGAIDITSMPPNDPYFVIIPIVEFTSLHGTSVPYKIAAFAGFYITSYTKAGDVDGVFIRWAAPGEWSDEKPPGNLYVETAVLTD